MPNYVLLNDDYLASDYVESAYVGTADDLYVEIGYIQDAIQGVASVSAVSTVSVNGGFLLDGNSTSSSAFAISITGNLTRGGTASSSSVCSFTSDADVIRSAVITPISAGTVTTRANAIVSPGADISASATTTVNAIANKVGTVSIQAFQTHPTLWSADVTWDNPVGTIWGPMVQVRTVAILSSEASSSSAFSVTVDGDRTAVANIAPAASASITVFANKEIQGLPNVIASAGSVTVDGELNVVSQQVTLSSTASVTAIGIFQVAGYPNAIGGVADVTTDGDVIRNAVVNTIPNSTSVTSKFGRIRPYTSNISSAFDLSATAISQLEAVSIVASAGTLSISAVKTGNAEVVPISSEFTLPRWVGGILFGGIIDIQAFATTVSALTLYNIDPFRVYVVDSETRLLGITQETRISSVNSETRVNSIEEETREYKVPSEIRTIEVQPLELVELSGIKDRRIG